MLLCGLVLLVFLSSPCYYVFVSCTHSCHFFSSSEPLRLTSNPLYCMLSETSDQRVNWLFFNISWLPSAWNVHVSQSFTHSHVFHSLLLQSGVFQTFACNNDDCSSVFIAIYYVACFVILVFVCSSVVDSMVTAFRITVHEFFPKFCNMNARSVCWKLLLLF